MVAMAMVVAMAVAMHRSEEQHFITRLVAGSSPGSGGLVTEVAVQVGNRWVTRSELDLETANQAEVMTRRIVTMTGHAPNNNNNNNNNNRVRGPSTLPPAPLFFSSSRLFSCIVRSCIFWFHDTRTSWLC